MYAPFDNKGPDNHNQSKNNKRNFWNANKPIKLIKIKNTYDDLTYNPPPALYKFYQICSFKDETLKYCVRIIVFNEKLEIIDQYNSKYNKKDCKKLIKSLKSCEGKLYATCDINLVDLPSVDDLLKVQSSLIS